jgi:hypothetical protein
MLTMTTPLLTRLDELVSQAADCPQWRVDGLWPAGGRVLLAAQYKAGKTTLVANLVRSLVDAEPFLERFPVTPGERVVLIDDELDPRTLARWLADQNIDHLDRIEVVSLRGHLADFDVMTPEGRKPLADAIRGADVVVLDCLRPMLDALGLSEATGAGKFVLAFDALLREADISEAIVVHHFGHDAQRARGDSRLLDWPDALWRLTRAGQEPDSPRFLSAYGRDVDQPQARLWFEAERRRLTLTDPCPAPQRLRPTLTELLERFGEEGAHFPLLAEPEDEPRPLPWRDYLNPWRRS